MATEAEIAVRQIETVLKIVSEAESRAQYGDWSSTYGHLMPGARDEVRERMDEYLAAATV